MRTFFAFLLAGFFLVSAGLKAHGQDEGIISPTPAQLKAAQEGFDKVKGYYDYVFSPSRLVGMHTFAMPHLTRDDKMKLLPEVSFTFGLTLQQTALTPEGTKELKKYKHLRRLNLSFTEVTTEDFENLAEIPSLQELDLTSSWGKGQSFRKMTATELKEIPRLKNLTTLSLALCQLTPDGLAQLKGLPRLTKLSISTGQAPFTPPNPAGVASAVKELKSVTTLGVDHANSATFRELKDAKQLRTLQMNVRGPVANIGLKELGELDQLTGIEMHIYPGTDEDLQVLGGLKNLTALKFTSGETGITDVGLKNLKGHQSLQTLYLTSNKITDAGVKEITQVKSLKTLRLSCKLTQACLADLKDLANLTTLHLDIDGLSEKGMADLTALKKLRYLHARIPDSCVDQLKGLPDLSAVVFPFGLTDTGLKKLQDIRSLRYVNVFFSVGNTWNHVSGKGIETFREARPDCIISPGRPQELGFEREDIR